MAYTSSGFIWDAAAKKGRSIRVYGEFCQEELVKVAPKPKSWLQAWEDRKNGGDRFQVTANTSVVGLRKYIQPHVICLPLVVTDHWPGGPFRQDYHAATR